MEFGGQEIMLGLGILVLVAIVLDVVRRVRRARYEKIRMPRRKQPIFDDDTPLDEYGSELPSGGARVVAQRGDSDLEEMTRSLKDIAEANKPKLSIPVRQPEQSALDLDEAPENISPPAPEEKIEPEVETSEPATVSAVLVLNLMAAEGRAFDGDDLIKAFLANGLRYGSMKIFHCHGEGDCAGNVLFSVANSVNPGIFDLKTIAEFSSPGISLFFATDDVMDPVQAFEKMLEVAEDLAQRLGGQLRDEKRQPLTSQEIERCRLSAAKAKASATAGNR